MKYLDFATPASKHAGEFASDFRLKNQGLTHLDRVYWNLPTSALYEEAVFRGEAHIVRGGPLILSTGKHTARAAADKYVVREQSTEDQIWWGEYNRPCSRGFSARNAWRHDVQRWRVANQLCEGDGPTGHQL